MDYVACLGAGVHVSVFCSSLPFLCFLLVFRNATNPRLASSSKDGTVRVWSTALRKTLFTLGGHAASVNVVRWGGSGGPKGALYTASSDRTVKVWDAEVGKQLFSLNQHAHWVTTLTLNTDFVTRTGPFDHTGRKPSSDEEGKKKLLDPFSVRSNTQKKNTAQKLAKDRIDALLRTTPELLISGSDDHTLFLWSPFAPSPTRPAHKPITRLTGHQRQVFHVAFAPDGRLAASCSWDGSVRVWEGRTGRFVATLRGHVGPVYRLAWSADGRMLVSASKDSTVKVGRFFFG